MSRKAKLRAEEKARIIRKYMDGRIRLRDVADALEVGKPSKLPLIASLPTRRSHPRTQ